MKQFLIGLTILLMLYTASGCSLTKRAPVVNWQVAGVLPPATGQSRSLGVAGPVAGRLQDLLLVGGGANFPDSMPWLGGKKKYYNEVYAFRKEADREFRLYKRGKLPFNLAYAANLTTSTGVISAGGENETGLLGKVLLLQWDKKSDNLVVSYLPDLPQALTNAAITSIGNVLYLVGGETATGVSQGFYSLDLDNTAAGWVSLPDLPKPISHAVVVTQSSGEHACIYVIGGRKRNAGGISDLYASVFQYDPVSKAWSPRRPLPYSLSAGTGLAMDNYHIAVFGGDRGETFHKAEDLIAAIARESDDRRKEDLNREKIALQAGHPGFSREVLWYNTREDVWTTGGVIPFEAPVTTTALKWGDEVVIPSGEIKAGVRSPRILAGVVKP